MEIFEKLDRLNEIINDFNEKLEFLEERELAIEHHVKDFMVGARSNKTLLPETVNALNKFVTAAAFHETELIEMQKAQLDKKLNADILEFIKSKE